MLALLEVFGAIRSAGISQLLVAFPIPPRLNKYALMVFPPPINRPSCAIVAIAKSRKKHRMPLHPGMHVSIVATVHDARVRVIPRSTCLAKGPCEFVAEPANPKSVAMYTGVPLGSRSRRYRKSSTVQFCASAATSTRIGCLECSRFSPMSNASARIAINANLRPPAAPNAFSAQCIASPIIVSCGPGLGVLCAELSFRRYQSVQIARKTVL